MKIQVREIIWFDGNKSEWRVRYDMCNGKGKIGVDAHYSGFITDIKNNIKRDRSYMLKILRNDAKNKGLDFPNLKPLPLPKGVHSARYVEMEI